VSLFELLAQPMPQLSMGHEEGRATHKALLLCEFAEPAVPRVLPAWDRVSDCPPEQESGDAFVRLERHGWPTCFLCEGTDRLRADPERGPESAHRAMMIQERVR
jgi:hypothetical protein